MLSHIKKYSAAAVIALVAVALFAYAPAYAQTAVKIAETLPPPDQLPDLAINYFYAKNSTEFSLQICNRGSQTAAAETNVTVTFYNKTTNKTVDSPIPNFSLKAGECRDGMVEIHAKDLNITKAGWYQISATIDAYNIIKESNENNNITWFGNQVYIDPQSTNQLPVITGVSGPTSLKVNETGTWSVTANDPDSAFLTFNILWGDEQSEHVQTPYTATPTQKATFTHSYAQSGTYTITFTVTDDKGAGVKATVSVNVTSADTPSITVISPTWTDAWQIGFEYNILWTYPTELADKKVNLTVVALPYPSYESNGIVILKQDGVTVPAPDVSGKRMGNTIWKIPLTIKAGKYNVLVRAVAVDVEKCCENLSALFSIIESPTSNKPTITSISPASGQVGTTLTIYGKNLQDDCGKREERVCQLTVSLGGYEIKRDRFAELKVTWLQDRIMLVVPPKAQTGAVRIVRVDSDNPDKSYDIIGPVFTVSKPVAEKPVITSISPTSGAIGATLAIYGKNLGNDCSARGSFLCTMQIYFGNYGDFFNPTTGSWTSEKIIIPVPQGAETGVIKLYRREDTNDDWRDASPIDEYTITGPVFTVTGLPDLQPTILTIKNRTRAMEEKWQKGDIIDVSIGIKNAGEASSGEFLYTVSWGAPDKIQSNVLSLAPGDTYSLTTSIAWSDVVTGNLVFTLKTDTGNTIQESVESNNTLAKNLNTAGTTPVITSIDPTSGHVGTTVTIYGKNLKDYCVGKGSLECIANVWIGETWLEDQLTRDDLISWNEDVIVIKIPENIASGAIRVYRNEIFNWGTADAYTDTIDITGPAFTVTSVKPQPSITSITPTSGPVGTKLTIYGKNLQDDCGKREERVCQLTVSLGGYEIKRERFVEFKVTWLQDRITVIVPPGALTGAVRIVRVDSENPEKSYDIIGPVFTVRSLGGYTIKPTQVEPTIPVTTEIPLSPTTHAPTPPTATEIRETAQTLHSGQLETLLAEIRELRSQVREQETKIKYLEKLTSGTQEISQKTEDQLNTFIAYGVDDNTKRLGEGERAAVLYSFKSAFNKLPESEDELNDAILIANGHWPKASSEEAEAQAKASFKKIYKREANMDNKNDNVAITVMAYGLRQRPENRNLKSEARGIATFKNIYGHVPQTTEEWNIMQGITYSGAARKR